MSTSITDRAAIVLQQIDAALALAEKATPGPWEMQQDDTGDEFTGWPSIVTTPELDASVIHRAGFKQQYWGDWSQREAVANASFISTSRTLLPASLRCLKTAIEGLLPACGYWVGCAEALATLLDQWEATK